MAELELAGLTQADLCRLLGVSAVTVNRWCRQRRDGVPIPRYARSFLKLWHLSAPNARALLLNDLR